MQMRIHSKTGGVLDHEFTGNDPTAAPEVSSDGGSRMLLLMLPRGDYQESPPCRHVLQWVAARRTPPWIGERSALNFYVLGREYGSTGVREYGSTGVRHNIDVRLKTTPLPFPLDTTPLPIFYKSKHVDGIRLFVC